LIGAFPTPTDHGKASMTTHQPISTANRVRQPPSELITPLAIAVAALLLCWFRLPGVARDTMWAEDGRIFLSEREHLGAVATLFKPYAGYLHLLPRFIADGVVAVLPPERYALGFAVGGFVIVGGVCALVFICTRDLLTWLPARVAFASIAALTPTSPLEVLGNAANVHWYCLWLAPWLLLAGSNSRVRTWALAGVALLLTLTEIQAVLFVPLILWKIRDRRTIPIRAAFALGLLIQLATTALSPRPAGRDVTYHWPSVVEGFLANGAMGTWTSHWSAVAQSFAHGGGWLAAAALVPFLACAAFALWRGTHLQRVAAAACVAGAVLTWSVAYLANPYPGFDYAALNAHGWESLGFVRYGVVPSMLLAATVPIAATILWARRQRAVPIIVIVALAALFVTQLVPASTQRSSGPDWRRGLVDKIHSCTINDAPDFVAVPVAPPGWQAEIPCAALR
jgi:hypothetical protein